MLSAPGRDARSLLSKARQKKNSVKDGQTQMTLEDAEVTVQGPASGVAR